MFQSEIRFSKINQLLEKVANRNYGKFLLRIRIARARAFLDQPVTFDFPVTALIGPNGGGKTTILGAAACLYRDVRPGLFFAKSGRFDASMQDWSIEYEAIDREIRRNDVVRRTASFRSYRWKRYSLDRKVLIFGVARTVPVNERREMRKCISGTFDVADDRVTELNPEVVDAVGRILDKDVSAFRFIRVDERGSVSLLAGSSNAGEAYSEFHFGAGESSVIRMAMELEAMEDNALVLVEEIENGLHPVATIRMIEYLIELALRKSCQVILTTHSNDALVPLPDKAIWAAADGKVFQGKLDIHSLRAITGKIDSRLVIFVEDVFAKAWLLEILRSLKNVAIDAIGVHYLEGDGTAVKVHISHNQDPTVQQKSVCFIDGDSQQQENYDALIFRLPGESPESYIFGKVLEKLDDLIGLLAVALLRPYEEQNRVAEVIRSVGNTNRDPHLLFSQIGKKLGLLSEARVREAFLSVWAQGFSEEVQHLVYYIQHLIPKEEDEIELQLFPG